MELDVNYTEMQNLYVLPDPNREDNDNGTIEDDGQTRLMSQMEADIYNKRLRYEGSDLRWIIKR